MNSDPTYSILISQIKHLVKYKEELLQQIDTMDNNIKEQLSDNIKRMELITTNFIISHRLKLQTTILHERLEKLSISCQLLLALVKYTDSELYYILEQIYKTVRLLTLDKTSSVDEAQYEQQILSELLLAL